MDSKSGKVLYVQLRAKLPGALGHRCSGYRLASEAPISGNFLPRKASRLQDFVFC